MSIEKKMLATVTGVLCTIPLVAMASVTTPAAPVPAQTEAPLLVAQGFGSGSGPSRSGRDYPRLPGSDWGTRPVDPRQGSGSGSWSMAIMLCTGST